MNHEYYDFDPKGDESVNITTVATDLGSGEAFLTTVFKENRVEFIVSEDTGERIYSYEFDIADFCDLIEQHDLAESARLYLENSKKNHPTNRLRLVSTDGGGKENK